MKNILATFLFLFLLSTSFGQTRYFSKSVTSSCEVSVTDCYGVTHCAVGKVVTCERSFTIKSCKPKACSVVFS